MARGGTDSRQRDAGVSLQARQLGSRRGGSFDRGPRPLAQSATCGGNMSVTHQHEIIFLFDVDNTLLDNDRVQADLDAYISYEFGVQARDRYWTLFEEL